MAEIESLEDWYRNQNSNPAGQIPPENVDLPPEEKDDGNTSNKEFELYKKTVVAKEALTFLMSFVNMLEQNVLDIKQGEFTPMYIGNDEETSKIGAGRNLNLNLLKRRAKTVEEALGVLNSFSTSAVDFLKGITDEPEL